MIAAGRVALLSVAAGAAVTVTLDVATLTLTGQDVVPAASGSTTVTLDIVTLTFTPQNLVAGAGTVSQTLDIATLTFTPQDLVAEVGDVVPGPPLNLVATPGDGEVTLTWDPPTSDGGASITDYIVQYREVVA